MNVKKFKVTVVIPVYNAEKFIEKAVESVVNLDEVAEVIIVEDGSKDNCLEICKKLSKNYPKIKLLQHPNAENKGESASRNLGISCAESEYIAFLDADDWYLPHRFIKDEKVFSSFKNADVAYSCTILEENQRDFDKRYGAREDNKNILGYDISPKEFYKEKLKNKWVLFNTNSITIRKAFLIEDKCFDERLKLHQDSELWSRLFRRGNFYAAEFENPVAVVRRHDNNTISNRTIQTHLKMIAILIDNVGLKQLYDFEIDDLYERVLREKSKSYSNNFKRRLYYFLNFVFQYYSKKQLLSKIRNYYVSN
jgi:glycosyltransferase involved in cell wall biosynthesis